MEYFAILGNVDATILEINLGDGFTIEQIEIGELASLCEDEFGIADVWPKIDFEWGCVPERTFYRPNYAYVIKKTLVDYPVFDGDQKDIEARKPFWDLEHKYQSNVSDYLEDKVRKLRLLKEGSIRISIEFYYSYEDDYLDLDSSTEHTLSCEHRLYTLTTDETYCANQLLTQDFSTKIPKYLQFALSNFEQSYQVAHKEFEFLSLMIALEALLNDGKTELRLRIARGCAILLGETLEESREVFKLARDLYDKRSVLVHTGDRNKIADGDVLLMKDLVRRALKKALELKLSKQDFSSLLMESGFGSLGRE